VAIDREGRAAFGLLARIDAIAVMGAARAMIDMPIGLPESGYRACDHAARRLLGAARSRVFLGARRPLLGFTDYAAANAWAKSDGKGLSRQCWHILPKIAEVDAFITPALQDTVLEAHPELVFQRLNRGHALPPKKTPEGLRLRRALLAAGGFAAIDRWIAMLRGSGARADDLCDACALALAAQAPAGPVPCARETDACGLRMEIWG
jgi:predicted RNase H-like nuclease